MIGVEEAKRILLQQATRLPERYVPLADAVGSYLSHDALISLVDHPLFACSAVDGYAFAFEGATEWHVVAEVAAGQRYDRPVAPGECVRIFTGAMMPPFTDTVVMQEYVQREGDRITHSDAGLQRLKNVRKPAEQVKAGDLVMRPGERYTPALIGLLAGLGYKEVPVARCPKVAVMITGDEFAENANAADGRIFSSNDVMLKAALRQQGIETTPAHCSDDREALSTALTSMVPAADLIITTGGASVGDHDLVHAVLEHLGAIIHFHGVAQKPGKPMLFATLGGVPVLALPGNPRAVMVCFWEYVLPFLRAMQGAEDPWGRREHLPLAHVVKVKGDRAEFRAAQVRGGQVHLLRDEGSHMLRSLVEADALAYLPSDRREWSSGDPMEVHYLPQ